MTEHQLRRHYRRACNQSDALAERQETIVGMQAEIDLLNQRLVHRDNLIAHGDALAEALREDLAIALHMLAQRTIQLERVIDFADRVTAQNEALAEACYDQHTYILRLEQVILQGSKA